MSDRGPRPWTADQWKEWANDGGVSGYAWPRTLLGMLDDWLVSDADLRRQLREAQYRHWCNRGHERIGLMDPSDDAKDDDCPLCIAIAKLAAASIREAGLRKAVETWDRAWAEEVGDAPTSQPELYPMLRRAAILCKAALAAIDEALKGEET